MALFRFTQIFIIAYGLVTLSGFLAADTNLMSGTVAEHRRNVVPEEQPLERIYEKRNSYKTWDSRLDWLKQPHTISATYFATDKTKKCAGLSKYTRSTSSKSTLLLKSTGSSLLEIISEEHWTSVIMLPQYCITAALTTVVLNVRLSYAVTPSPDLPQWTVRDVNRKICMLMAMNAAIQGDPEIPFPQTATASPQIGSCDPEMALFTLEWRQEGGSFYSVTIAFTVDGNSYKMDAVNGTVIRGFTVTSWSNIDSTFPSASIGNSMTCGEFDSGNVYFYEFQFQPFAQQSGEEYGKAEGCSSGSTLLVNAVFVAMLFFEVVVLM